MRFVVVDESGWLELGSRLQMVGGLKFLRILEKLERYVEAEERLLRTQSVQVTEDA